MELPLNASFGNMLDRLADRSVHWTALDLYRQLRPTGPHRPFRPQICSPPDDTMMVLGRCEHLYTRTPSGRSKVGGLAVVKLPRPSHMARGEGCGLYNEIEFITSVNPDHPSIVRYLGATDDLLFMQLCPHGSLAEYRPRSGERVPILRWAKQVVSGLKYLHETLHQSHNDLSPEKILIDDYTERDGRPSLVLKISGFGDASPLDSAESSGRYMLPESDDDLPANYGYPSPGREDSRSEVDGSKFDMFHFGLVFWFIQDLARGTRRSGRTSTIPPPPRGIYTYLDYLDFEGMMLKGLMRRCLSHWSKRPSAARALRLLRDAADRT